ncbi:hypothetical protein HMPREF1317_1365 [Schaalia georgiae F0490]|uniref:Uncharacterized protein n=1 Tax=Schaalia georgiae F0490 TaxID=1125717 RepID=J1HM79_9ACTO|nr:hypothetical protein HMPREF1317_1365 [Schaalia georgiae F0490]
MTGKASDGGKAFNECASIESGINFVFPFLSLASNDSSVKDTGTVRAV